MKSQPKNNFQLFSLFSFLFILALFSILSLQSQSKQTYISNAQTPTCTEPTGNETYTSAIAKLGPKIATNIGATNYKQIRKLYNCANPDYKDKFIPVTVIYDLFFLKTGSDGIVTDLNSMKQYGLYPIIRIASYMSGGNWIKMNQQAGGTDDAKIIGQYLGESLRKVGGFPEAPVVYFGNEPNLDAEWGGKSDVKEFASAFNSFVDGMGSRTNFKILFPPLSYSSTNTGQFLATFFVNFSVSLDGAAYTIYGTDYTSIKNQYNQQQAAFNPYPENFFQPMVNVITEMGPVKDGKVIENCADGGDWSAVAGPIIKAFLADPVVSKATMACFTATQTYLMVPSADKNPTLTTLTAVDTTKTQTGGNQTQTGPTVINFNPQNPSDKTKFVVDISSNVVHVYVYMKIFKKDNSLAFAPVTNSDKVPQVINGKPIHWLYEITNGLDPGEYIVKFYINCLDATGNNCTEVTGATRSLSIGTGKTNDVQTVQQQTQQETQNQTQQTQTQTGTNTGGQQQKTQTTAQNQNPLAHLCDVKIQTPGDKNKKYDLLFLADDYSSREQFLKDVNDAVSKLNDTNLGTTRINKINFWAYDDLNIDFGGKNCGSKAGYVSLCVNWDLAQSFKDTCGDDGYVVLVNSAKLGQYWDAASSNGLGAGQTALSNAVTYALAHELGHSISSLNDEYPFAGGATTDSLEYLQINCSVKPSNNQEIPCLGWEKYSDVHCYPICGYHNWYRSTIKSAMNGGQANFNNIFNPPSLEGWDYALKNYE